ncbi:hypothetical protein ACFL6H_01760 [Candidatus Latescibacterota bacterium]
MRIIFIFLMLLIITHPYIIWTQEINQEWETLRFSDENGDGINDLFRDADGDGKNDNSGKQYRRRFPFIDSDNDSVNDIFRDADGNGVNDLLENMVAGEKEEVEYSIIDFDDDGINDVTGKKYIRKLSIRSYIDENGDGIDDRETWIPVKSLLEKIAIDNKTDNRDFLENMDGPTMDRFIDEDGDGINDGRIYDREKLDENFSK